MNPDHCGACGVRCDPASQACRGGVCVTVASRCSPLGPADAGADAAADGGATGVDASFDGAVDEQPPNDGTQGFRGEYYAATDLTHLVLARVDPRIDFDWSTAAPGPGVPRENFSVRWTGQVRPRYAETYTFLVATDDGSRLWVDGNLVDDDWIPHGVTERRATVALEADRAYDVRMEYFQGTSGASARLSWQSASQAREVIGGSRATPATGLDFGCADGFCCATTGAAPVCCPAGGRCVDNRTFRGCCPAGQPCGEVSSCGGTTP